MTSNNKRIYLQLNPDTVENVRKQFNLHKKGVMDQAIDVLSDWVHKQEHFMKKDLPRGYLERSIISAKGSVEIAKKRIDRLFTMQTMSPNLFQKCHATKGCPNTRGFFLNLVIPRLSEDNSRIHIGKLMTKTITPAACLEAYQHLRIILEYLKLHDYAHGYRVVYDLGDVDVSHLISNVDWVDIRACLDMIIEGYGYRLLNIYIVSPSKIINALVKLIKQMVSDKIGKRIQVVKNMESLHLVMPKEFLPEEFGGDQKPILELYDEMNEFLTSPDHVAHMEEMKKARTIEELRSSESFNEEYLGMPGSFKLSEYMKLYDYTIGYQVICDLREVNILDLVTKIDLVDLRNVMSLYTNEIHFTAMMLQSSKNGFIPKLKQGNRTLHCVPEDYFIKYLLSLVAINKRSGYQDVAE